MVLNSKILISIIWLFLFAKSLFFWVWLWQLKEYHLGRFRAHFETEGLKKIISGFWRVKSPLITRKTIFLLFSGLVFEALIFWLASFFELRDFYFILLGALILSPLFFSLIILLFQIPTEIIKKRILKNARQKRGQLKNLLVIGITGSYGKTSTKEFLFQILSAKFNVLKTGEHINAEIGIAKTILKELNEKKEIFIVEMGAYEEGKIKEVCQMVKPKIGVLTGINEQHLSTFGSLEKTMAAKYELIESLPKDGLAIFNGNNFYCRQLYEKTKIAKKIVLVSDKKFEEEFFKDILPWDKENFLLAAAVAESLGVEKQIIKKAAKEIQSQIKIIKSPNNADVVLSVYSANPKSIMGHLDYLKQWQGRRVLVMPCLIELGKSSKAVHLRIGEKIGQIADLAIITTKDRFEELKTGAIKKGMSADRIIFCPDSKIIFNKIKNFIGDDGVILLENRVPKDLIELLSEKHGN